MNQDRRARSRHFRCVVLSSSQHHTQPTMHDLITRASPRLIVTTCPHAYAHSSMYMHMSAIVHVPLINIVICVRVGRPREEDESTCRVGKAQRVRATRARMHTGGEPGRTPDDRDGRQTKREESQAASAIRLSSANRVGESGDPMPTSMSA